MLTALLVLCAVAANAAPLAAKPATAADSELSTLLTARNPPSPAVLTSSEVKVSKLKKFPASGQDLKGGKKLSAAPKKLKDVATGQTPALSIAMSVPSAAPLAAVEESSPLPERDIEVIAMSVPSAAPLAAVEESSPLPERDIEVIAMSAPSAAPLAAVEESLPPPERDIEVLKAHIAPSFVATAMFEDEKASRFRHSTLSGFSSFF